MGYIYNVIIFQIFAFLTHWMTPKKVSQILLNINFATGSTLRFTRTWRVSRTWRSCGVLLKNWESPWENPWDAVVPRVRVLFPPPQVTLQPFQGAQSAQPQSWDTEWYRMIVVGGWATHLKNMSSSVGMMTFPIYGKIIQMFQTTNQYKDMSLLQICFILFPSLLQMSTFVC